MLAALTRIETLVGLAFLVLSLGECLSHAKARQEGKTSNRSRLVTRGTISALVLAILAYGRYWQHLVSDPDFYTAIGDKPVWNWPYTLLGIAVFLLLSYELVGIWRARLQGLTSNLSRLFSHLAMLLLLLAMATIALQRWNLYLEGFGIELRGETERLSIE